MNDQAMMQLALSEARTAMAAGEVPVGAVVVRHGQVIATGRNTPIDAHNPTAHAEMEAIRAAARAIGNERLDDCDLWVTLEPCPMCAGAIAHARIARVYYAAPDPKGGGVDHGPRIFTQPTCHHRPDVYSGLGEAQASDQLRAFFAAKRSAQ